MPRFIARPTTALKSSTCRSAASSWAATCPSAKSRATPLEGVPTSHFEEFYKGTEGREVSTTMVFVRLLSKLLRDPEIGKLIVPIIPDEARTFGMEALFRQVGIYSSVGQLYEPVDMDTLLYYKEAKRRADSGRRHHRSRIHVLVHRRGHRLCQSRHQHDSLLHLLLDVRVPADRRSDLGRGRHAHVAASWLAAQPGRTTLAGEGLQHQDGHSHVLALRVPNCLAYDPAFAYEIAIIIQDGISRMYVDGESIFYYLTVTNEPLPMPEMPDGDGSSRRHSQRPVPFQAVRKERRQAARATFRQRHHHVRGVEGAADSRREIWCRRRRLERDQLQAALSRRQRLRTLEHAASRTRLPKCRTSRKF